MSTGTHNVSGLVFDIQRMSVHDGPGIRTTVFLKGCPLECVWCHNPEGRLPKRQLAFTPSLCIGCGYCRQSCPAGAHVMTESGHAILRDRCGECFSCVEQCHAKALEVVGEEMGVDDVLKVVARDKPFYDESGGGVTVSGGEPLAQARFTQGLLAQARAMGIHTCIETCGLAHRRLLEPLVSDVDLFLFDYKETDPRRHLEYTGHTNEQILDNLRFLDSQGAAIVLRCPIVPGLNLRDDHIEGIASLARSLRNCQGVNIMGYHALGLAKHERLGVGREGMGLGPDMTPEDVAVVVRRVAELGVGNVSAG